jgi:hypothetical protein
MKLLVLLEWFWYVYSTPKKFCIRKCGACNWCVKEGVRNYGAKCKICNFSKNIQGYLKSIGVFKINAFQIAKNIDECEFKINFFR